MTGLSRSISNKRPFGRFFENFVVGEVIEHATPRTITEGDVALYTALTGSRFALYSSQPFAQSCGFDRIPVDNLLVFHLAFGKTVNDISLNAVANLGYAETQFLRPAFVGDTLIVTSQVIGKKENSNGKSGIVYVHSKAINQNNIEVLSWKRWVMVRKHSNEPAPAHDIPELMDKVSVETLTIPKNLDFNQINYHWSGSQNTLNDFEPGEVLLHRDGITINPSDHSLATRMYQNNARVHFDRHFQQKSNQEPLVYGGHIISICRALSFSGLANAMWLSAINSGSHIAPCYAGDTVSAASTIIDKGIIEENKNIGWIRVQTNGFKNSDEDSIECFMLEKGSDANQVLSWDYTLLIPIN